MQPIDRMKGLIKELPKSDWTLGEKFIAERNFESLQELVDSAIYKVRKGLRKEFPKEEYLNVNLTELSILKSEVDNYVLQLELLINVDEEEKLY